MRSLFRRNRPDADPYAAPSTDDIDLYLSALGAAGDPAAGQQVQR
ncbi:hypothetical protein GCM10022221_68310 [Actinocorallia aurea]